MMLPALLVSAAQLLSLGDYRARLERLDTLLTERNVEAVRLEAQDLQGASYTSGEATLSVDNALMLSLENLGDSSTGLAEATRLRATLRALNESHDPGHASPDPELARRLRLSWDQPLAKGSTQVPGLNEPQIPAFIPDWVYTQWVRLVKWIQTWLPEPENEKAASKAETGASTVAGLIAAGALLLLVALAWLAFRKRAVAPAVEAAEVLTAEKDDDPTARQSDEWIVHAATLERQGHLREALRAWYHAALSALISRGLVAYAKGRTNWEYVAAVSPGAPFKTGLTNATLRFEECWYGGAPVTRDLVSEQRAEVQRCLAFIGKRAAA